MKREFRHTSIVKPPKKLCTTSNFLCDKGLEPFIPLLLENLKFNKEIEVTQEEEALVHRVTLLSACSTYNPQAHNWNHCRARHG